MAGSGQHSGAGRRLPMGAEIVEGGAHFRVWAPRCRSVEVVFEDHLPALALDPEPDGWFSGWAREVRAGARYRYRLDGGEAFPDPASRFQPEGPFGPSEIVDPSAFAWTDARWRGLRRGAHVVYELHVGTFTPEGSWDAAAGELPWLAQLGITVIEMMPVADFPGRFGWGYDGVNLFAPTRLYGTPDDLRRFVDRAHALGMGVILDVVWNHLGPSGNFLHRFSEDYFTRRYLNEWGEPFNFDGEHSGPVRDTIVANARCWIDEFHFDGLRIDATQALFDASPRHIVADVVSQARQAAGERSVWIVVENEPQDTWLVRPEREGGCGADAVWNDDFHHAARVALTGRREAYYLDYLGTPQEFVSIARTGFLYQGQHYRWQRKRRGTPTRGLHPRAFVCYLQNHDQVANSARGRRLPQLTSPGRYRAMTALLLLGPWTPLLFQGQEYGATTPFTWFADHELALAPLVREGRADFLRQFESIAAEHGHADLPDPADPDRFRRAVLDRSERDRNEETVRLHRDLLRLRRTDPAFRTVGPGTVQGAVLSAQCFALRFTCGDTGPVDAIDGDDAIGADDAVDVSDEGGGGDRLLIVNLGVELHPEVLPEPLLAPPDERGWTLLWSSESPRYGGRGTPAVEAAERFRIPPEAAVVLGPAVGSEHVGATAGSAAPGGQEGD